MGHLCLSVCCPLGGKCTLQPQLLQSLVMRIVGSQCKTRWIGVSGFGKASRTDAPAVSKTYGESLDEHGEGSCGEFDQPLGRDTDALKRWKSTTTTFSQENRISRHRTSRNVRAWSRGGTVGDKIFQGGYFLPRLFSLRDEIVAQGNNCTSYRSATFFISSNIKT
ncbi:hypothetical protein CPC08DRAFT_323178 [Agrocybe pediades]|nr:hypothetical protein CPC08DRAFT_323178 [Agrocybe pediades]